MYVCLEVEKCKDEKFFCLIEKKNERMENVVYINLFSRPN